MIFAVVGLLGFGAFAVLSRAAGRGSDSARADAIVVGAMLLTAAGFAAMLALWLSSLACDESCDPTSTDWARRPDAWQWPVQADIAMLGFGAVATALGLTIGRRHRSALIAAGAAVGAFAAWGAFLSAL